MSRLTMSAWLKKLIGDVVFVKVNISRFLVFKLHISQVTQSMTSADKEFSQSPQISSSYYFWNLR